MHCDKIKTNLKNEFGCEETLSKLKEFKAVIAGGALTSVVTGRKINDFDIYFKTKEECEKAINHFIDDDKWKVVATTDNAVTFKKEITLLLTSRYVTMQLVQAEHMFYEDPMDLIKNFDFTINMAAYDLEKESILFDTDFVEHNMQRKLVFNEDTLYPIISMHRAVKYMNRGYKLDGYEQVKIALAINNLHMKDYRDLKAQLQGIDTSIFKSLTDKLMEEPDMEYNYDTIIEKIKGGVDLKE